MCKSFSRRFLVAMSGLICAGAMALLAACSAAPRGNDEAPEPPTRGEDLFRRITETEPGTKGDSVNNVFKPAQLETGLEIKVPLHINVGDLVKVSTTTGEFMGRSNK